MSTSRLPQPQPLPGTGAPAPASRILRKGSTTRLGVRAVAAGELTPPSERFDRAAERGYADGYREGRKAAEAELSNGRAHIEGLRTGTVAELANTRAALGVAVSRAEEAYRDAANSSIEGFAEAAFALAEALVGRELELSPFPVIDALRRGLAEAPAGPTVLRVHPTDASNLADAHSLDALSGLAPGRDVTVVPDNDVEPGGCILEIGSATIDARLSSAIERVRRVLVDEPRLIDDAVNDLEAP